MDPFVGEIRATGFNFAPVGWLACNGQLLPIQQYAALFSILGVTYGGNGTTNFALPNLQGQTPTHFGQSAGGTNRPLGDVYGEETVTLNTSQIGAHQHNIKVAVAPPPGIVPAPASTTYIGHDSAVGGKTYTPVSSGPLAALNPAAIAPSTDGGQGHENRQPYLALNYIIAYSGIFPTRS